MADAITEAAAKLQLDEETGEMVSKNELKKRLAKRAKKASKAAAASDPSKKGNENNKAAAPKKPKPEETQLDPDAMFKGGFLARVYDERPVGKDVMTRFPPEPNGLFDDTNPEAEEEIYFTSIIQTIEWLGFTPHAITYSSDNFQRLYDLAEKLIGLEKAYVCHCNEAEIKLQRGGEKGTSPRYRCKHAEQDIETNLQKFRDMRDGKYAPQTAFLRMKQDITNPNPQHWDLAAYRVLSKPHHRTGDKWVIYPTYDFTHCIVDSIEGITHSLCTTEFQLSRESYEWLNSTLSLYEPMQREYGRLNISGTIMSKRGLKKLIDGNYVRGWDDPRLYTLIALRRRGIPPGAILSFINELGVTTANTVIQLVRFEQSVRRYLEFTVPRLMMVLEPLRIVIEDADSLESSERDLTIPFSPKKPELGTHQLRLTNTVFIDRSDFREVDSKDYFRLAPGKTVGLLNMPYPITATTFSKDADGKITEVRAVFNKDGKKPKTYVQWVPEESRKVEVRIHAALFKSDDPAGVEGGFLNDINPNSETIYVDALIEPGFDEVRRRAPWPASEGEKAKHGPESVRFQGLRIAYFCVDSDSTDDKVVLNRIVSLKEDSGKS
ncbi:putative glutamine--tRNA ligase [Talaromyces atroroseus]|uniref:glutamine--tRNA ligase n=1 Tax=Talaromyces atroroseus TaxID=1441469 RepID=A0A225B896_TALAT|nr:putative glutamine--tRNA ligase [Talaromyces atroroseus]OKL62167.1 putative glutamine--tRNA ligase [Talaromyces atroroseus]